MCCCWRPIVDDIGGHLMSLVVLMFSSVLPIVIGNFVVLGGEFVGIGGALLL